MRKQLVMAVMLAAGLTAGTGTASFLNAPHNPANGINCVNCHEYPFDRWPGYVADPGNLDSTVKNFVCLRCHDGTVDGPGEIAAPVKGMHSSAALSAKYGNWTTQCVDCHDPHFQSQVNYFQSDPSSLYLVVGSYTGLTLDTSTNPPTSTIGYTLLSADANWSDPATWSQKTGAGRGLVLVADTSAPYDTFEVLSAGPSSITVAGDLTQVMHNGTFGLIYGQLIRDKVRTPAGEKPVKFFAPNGGHVDTVGTPPSGICQVCHTQTLHWRSDGTLADHNTGSRCTGCHTPASGFKASFPNHTWLLKGGTTCEACHDPNGTADIVADIHKSNCADCHNVPNYASLRTGVNGDATLHGPVGQGNTSTCTVCHDPTVYPTSTFHHATVNAQNGNCTFCHSGGGAADHSTMVADYVNCTNCHSANVGSASGAPVDPANNRVHDACTTCHKTDGSLKALADLTRGIVVAMPTGGAASNDGGGDCSACHGEYFANHQNIDHATSRVTVSANCANCHDAVAGGTAPDAITSPFTTPGEAHGLRGCSTCHQTNGALVAPTATAPGIAAGGGNCETCHGQYFPQHQSPDHSAKVAGVTPCTDCHTATAGTATGIPTSATDAKVHDGCATCHNTTTGLLLSQAAANVNGYLTYGPAMAAGDCSTCHGNYFDHHVHGTTGGYVSHDVAHDPAVDLSQSAPGTPCMNCHDDAGLGKGTNALSTWDAIKTEHATVGGVAQASACATCHFYATNGNQSGDPDTPPLTTVQSTIATGAGVTCVTCHVPKDVNASPTTSGHGGHGPNVFGWAGNCNSCHTDNGLGVVEGVHGNNCLLCHDNPSGGPGTTIVGANGNGDATLGAALADYTTATCLTCHPSSTYPAPAIHHDTANAQSGNCEWCHADRRPDWAVQYGVNLPNPLPTGDMACKKCHVKGSGTGLTVYKNTYTPVAVSGFPNGDRNWGVTGDAAVQQTPIHVINGPSLITVQNYGICLGCHDGTYTNAQGVPAPQIQVWHAKPTWNKNTNDTANGIYDNTFDVMRNAPGRSYFADNNTPPRGGDDRNADDPRFNIFSTGVNTGGVAKVRMYGRYDFGSASKPYKGTNSETRGKNLYRDYRNDTDNPWINSVWSNRVTIPRVDAINNPWGLLSSDPQVPIVP